MAKKTQTPSAGASKSTPAGNNPMTRRNGDASRAMSSAEIRQAFLDFFSEMGHTMVPSSPLIPAGDETLLFTNAGMVQFKDVFLGLDKRAYSRAATSQKCMRVSGKHNDLENVGPSPRHHTFFEMLGNFSFGDYFKKDAIRYAYDCVTRVFGIPADRLYFTVHHTDDEAFNLWVSEVGVPAERVVRLGDKTNFWQMADTGPCGPTSEIHYDWTPDKGGLAGDELANHLDDNPDGRFLEIWNLVFMQFNQAPDGSRTPLPKPGVDTGMGLERLTTVIQGVDNSYDTDLFAPILDRIQSLASHDADARRDHLVAYRVIADHARAAAFLIADGVPPGNEGRNYVTRMVVRRAARFGGKIGFDSPFLAGVAERVVEMYGEVYPELVKHRDAILNTLTQEEMRFRRTVDTGVANLGAMLFELGEHGHTTLPGDQAFELYATYGLPLEITRDIARERGLGVDEAGFHAAMEAHRVASGAGQAMGELGGEDVAVYRELLQALQSEGKLGPEGVEYDPYSTFEVDEPLLALLKDGKRVRKAKKGDKVEVVLARTCFYIASGGQVADTGAIAQYAGAKDTPEWEIRIDDVRRPAAGIVVHAGEVLDGTPAEGDLSSAMVDDDRRWDIMRNHTATHLLHSELRYVLGEHVHQAGSLVAPDRLRFDFTHASMLTADQIHSVQQSVNDAVLANYPVEVDHKSRDEAIREGAMALFGEKYGSVVRTIRIGEPTPFSYELCGGTHVPETADIGPFLIVSEGSVAAGVRRVEAVTGRAALDLIQDRLRKLDATAAYLRVPAEEVDRKVLSLLDETQELQKEIVRLRRGAAKQTFEDLMAKVTDVSGVPVLAAQVEGADPDSMREMMDWFRNKVGSGVAVLGSVHEGKPALVASVTDDLVARGLHAGNLVKAVAQTVGGGGGGRPTLAQAGGKDASRLPEAIGRVPELVAEVLAK